MDTTPETMTTRRNDINNQLIQGIKEECSEIQVNNEVIIVYNDHPLFECPSRNPTKSATVVYSTQLHGNELANTSILVTCLDKWIKKSKYIVIDESDVSINDNCSGVVNDYSSDFDCGTISHNLLPHVYSVLKEFITGLSKVLCIFLIVIITIALIVTN